MISKRKKFKREKKFENKSLVIVLGILSLCFIGILITSSLKVSKKRIELQAQSEFLKKEIQILEEKKQRLEAGILESETEDYLEKEARDRLGLKKPGEEVVAIIQPKENQQNNATQTEKTTWRKILEKIGF